MDLTEYKIRANEAARRGVISASALKTAIDLYDRFQKEDLEPPSTQWEDHELDDHDVHQTLARPDDFARNHTWTDKARRNMYLAYHKTKSVFRLACVFLKHEHDSMYRDSLPPSRKHDPAIRMQRTVEVLLLLPHDLIVSLLTDNPGDYILAKHSDLPSTPDPSPSAKMSRPEVYMHVLRDEAGKRPTWVDVRRILKWITYYIDDVRAADKDVKDQPPYRPNQNSARAERILAIDTAIDPAFVPRRPASSRRQNSERRYLESSANIQAAKSFVALWDRRISDTLSKSQFDEHSEMTYDFASEAGYTINGAQRSHAHKNHQSSNLLMNLVEAITIWKAPHLRMRYRTVALVIHPELAMWVEHVISKIGGTYSHQGGCNTAWAGQVRSAKETAKTADYEAIWNNVGSAVYARAQEQFALLKQLEKDVEPTDEQERLRDVILELNDDTRRNFVEAGRSVQEVEKERLAFMPDYDAANVRVQAYIKLKEEKEEQKRAERRALAQYDREQLQQALDRLPENFTYELESESEDDMASEAYGAMIPTQVEAQDVGESSSDHESDSDEEDDEAWEGKEGGVNRARRSPSMAL